MRKVHLVCSLLMAFCASIAGLGCDSAKKPATTPAPKAATPGSTTGGGTSVPAGSGTKEKPKAKVEKKVEEKAPEAKPEEKAADPKTGQARSETGRKTDAKPEEAKTEEKEARIVDVDQSSDIQATSMSAPSTAGLFGLRLLDDFDKPQPDFEGFLGGLLMFES